MKCFICGQEMACSSETYHYKECGLNNVFVENVEVCRCDSCDENIACIQRLPELNSAIGEALLRKASLLNGKEIRFLRKNIGLKAVELQKYLGVNNATISRWEQTKQKISPGHDRLLRLVYAHFKGIPHDTITSLVKDWFSQIKREEIATPLYTIDPTKWLSNCLMPAV